MEKYYLQAIKLNNSNNSNAMYSLGYYHKSVNKNYKLMEKYYLMAIYNYNYKNVEYVLDYLKDYLKYYKLQKLTYFLVANNYKFENYQESFFNL